MLKKIIKNLIVIVIGFQITACSDKQKSQAEIILEQITLEEKLGKLFKLILACHPEEVVKYNLGSILNGGNSAPEGGRLLNGKWVALADASFRQHFRWLLEFLAISTDANTVITTFNLLQSFRIILASAQRRYRSTRENWCCYRHELCLDWVFAPTVVAVIIAGDEHMKVIWKTLKLFDLGTILGLR